jgi:hypothetical protein
VNERRGRKEGLKSVVFDFDFGDVANKRSCGNEVDKSLSQGKVRDYLLCNVF